jgi:hypothetical protein
MCASVSVGVGGHNRRLARHAEPLSAACLAPPLTVPRSDQPATAQATDVISRHRIRGMSAHSGSCTSAAVRESLVRLNPFKKIQLAVQPQESPKCVRRNPLRPHDNMSVSRGFQRVGWAGKS